MTRAAGSSRALCPRCGYDLSGTVDSWTDSCPLEGTCSECGLEFRWCEILHPLFRIPRWLFEHASRAIVRRLVSSWCRAMYPVGFWKSLKLHHPIRPARLAAFAVLNVSVFVVLLISYSTFMSVIWLKVRWAANPSWGSLALDAAKQWGWPFRRLRDWQLPTQDTSREWLFFEVVWIVLLPFAFAVVRQTMRARRVKPGHLFRASVYSLAPLLVINTLWLALRVKGLLHMGVVTSWTNPWQVRSRIPFRPNNLSFHLTEWPLGLVVAIFLFFWWIIVVMRYLRLPHAPYVAIATVAISGMATLALVGYWPGSDLLYDFGALIRWVQPQND